MLRFAYNTNGFAHHDLPDCLAILAGLGYAGVGLTLDVQHLHPFRATAADVGAVRRELERRKLAVTVETGARYVLDPRLKHEPTLLSTEGRDRRIDFLRRAIDVAAGLRAAVVSIWAGKKAPDVADEEAWARLEDGVGRVLDYAEQRGVRIAFEPEPGMLVEDLAGYDRLRARVGDRLRLTLDVGHVACTETMTIPEAIRKYGDRLANVHIEDIRGREHVHLPFGEGEIDFAPALRALEEVRYGGLVQVELSRSSHDAPEQARRSIEFLKGKASPQP